MSIYATLCLLATVAVAFSTSASDSPATATAAAAAASAAGSSGLFNWMTLGDWGGASISAQDKQNVYAVANQMATTAAASDPAFIVSIRIEVLCGVTFLGVPPCCVSTSP